MRLNKKNRKTTVVHILMVEPKPNVLNISILNVSSGTLLM